MSEPQSVDASTQSVAAGERPQLYKYVLNGYALKLWKQLPIYQTRNEGSNHLPITFQHHKMAEKDASKIAIFATRHTLKNEALRLVREEMTAKAKKKLNNL
ncbi:hypothetical protein L6452_40270 [Arctium lappa]|uniref:Uncharacterized protein n=1 Tax=Arctium lappa TaxID=4217 RepID=A0ACB8XQK8_ARCLA|nr:hypothetical protein L6452_40270 [Arctium lappa]